MRVRIVARKPRIHYEDAVYHVIARGNNRARVFEKSEEKNKYLDLLAGYKDRYGFQLYAYVIMDNHVHMLLRVGETPLAKVMQGIQQRYTQYYNRLYNHSGHVFEQRYKAFLCENDSYLIALVRYIHQNPVRVKMLEGIHYRWSSHQAYIGRTEGLTDVRFILDTLSSNPEQAAKQYLELMGTAVDKPECYNESQHEKCGSEAPQKTEMRPYRSDLTWEQLVHRITVEKQVSQDQLIGKCRIRQVAAARRRLIYEAIERDLMTRAQLAKILQMDPANITRICQEGD